MSDNQNSIANFKENFNKLFFTEDKKLKLKNCAIALFIGLLVVYFLLSYIAQFQKNTTAGSIDVDRNIYIPKEKKFNLESNNADTEEISISQDVIAAEVRRLLPQLLESVADNQKTITTFNKETTIQTISEDLDFKLENLKMDIISSNESRMSEIFDRLSVLENRAGTNLIDSKGQSPALGSYTSYDGQTEYFYSDQIPNGKAIIFDNYNAGETTIIGNFSERSQLSYQIVKGINVGTLIKATLETGAVSSGDKCPVKVTTLEDVSIGNTVVIPTGSYFIGYGVADASTRKIYIYLNKLVLGKREIDIRAHLIQSNMKPGFLDKYIDKTKSTLWTAAIFDFIAAAAMSFKDTIYIVSNNGIPTTYYPNTVNNAALDGISSAMSKYGEKLTNDAARMGFIMIVNPNKEGKIFIDEKIPIDKLITTIDR